MVSEILVNGESLLAQVNALYEPGTPSKKARRSGDFVLPRAGTLECELFENVDGQEDGRRVRLFRCSCGVEDCGDVTVHVQVGLETVTWRSIRLPGKDAMIAQLGPFVFDRVAYARALEGR